MGRVRQIMTRVRRGGFGPRRRRALFVAGAALMVCFAAFVAYVVAPMDTARYLSVQASGEMHDRDGRLLHGFLNEKEQWCFPREYGEFSTKLVQATVAVEDQRFWSHAGVDPIAVLRAALGNLTKRRVTSGASTITMQVVKLADDTPRSLLGKVAQAGTALRLDWHADKEDILCAYLNRAPYGLNLVGAEAASRRYFGKPANELNVTEAALLAGLPKAPTALQPLRHATPVQARRDHVLARMHAEGVLAEDAFSRATEAPLGASWHAFPRRAPHLAMSLGETRGAVRTTLDGALQARVEALLPEYLKRFDNEVTNGAVMVVAVSSGEVLVRVGGADFFDTPGGGQVDLCRATRSPGSTLKPFTYALAMEEQRLYSSEKLLDGVLDYGGYNPGNFDGEYNGLVTASDGLRYSLNVPAVTVLDRVGAVALQAFLRKAGLSTLDRPASHYGLGLTLGSCEVRMEEMMGTYCALANLGEYRPLRVSGNAEAVPPERWLSRGTSLALYGMLEQPFPDEVDSGLTRKRGIPTRVAWKTGTSTGLHDAWSFVFNRQYVVGVWLGNNDGQSSQRLVGARAALPLAAKVFGLLPRLAAEDWPAPGNDLREAEVCAVSGLPSGRYCTRVETVLLPRRQFLHRRCDMHGPDGVERWPGKARGWDLAAVKDPVVIAPEDRAETLRILDPPHGAEYVVTGVPDGDRIRAKTSLDDRLALHWYLDSAYLGVKPPRAAQWIALAPGEHTLVCMAESGQTDTVTFSVISR